MKMWAVIDPEGYIETVQYSPGSAVREVTERFGESWSWFCDRGWKITRVVVNVITTSSDGEA